MLGLVYEALLHPLFAFLVGVISSWLKSVTRWKTVANQESSSETSAPKVSTGAPSCTTCMAALHSPDPPEGSG